MSEVSEVSELTEVPEASEVEEVSEVEDESAGRSAFAPPACAQHPSWVLVGPTLPTLPIPYLPFEDI